MLFRRADSVPAGSYAKRRNPNDTKEITIMAKFTPGPAVATVSGSIGGTTFSRNRGGAYMRIRAIPVDPATSFQLNRRADLSTLSQNWQGLTGDQRQGWENWASQNPRVDALGQTFTMSGAMAYVSLNARIRADGGSLQDSPPIIPAPDAFTTMTFEADIGTGDFEINFTPTLASGDKVTLWAAIVNSAGITYVRNLYRHIGMSAVDQVSPYDIESIVAARLGTLVVGQTVHVKAGAYNPVTGLESPLLIASATVISSV